MARHVRPGAGPDLRRPWRARAHPGTRRLDLRPRPSKPIIDILLVVPDSRDEPTYVPDLEAAGFVLRIRGPEWHQHRLFKGPETPVNLHVFSLGSGEIQRMLGFRDHLRANPTERDRYAQTRRELAARSRVHVQHYADAKSEVIEAILAEARTEDAASCSRRAVFPALR